MKNFGLLLIVLLITNVCLYSQTINNINAKPQNRKIIVTYNLSGLKFNQTCTVSLFVSMDGGITFKGPLREVSGGVGNIKSNGKKVIIWDALKEMPFEEKTLFFDVRANIKTEKIKNHFFFSFVGNTITPVGLRLGLIGKTKFYIEGRICIPIITGEMNMRSPRYIIQNNNITNFREGYEYYIIDSKGTYFGFSFIAGITLQISKNAFLYSGAGYANEYLTYKMDIYRDGDYYFTTDAFHKEKSIEHGVEVDAGIMLRLKFLLISFGGTTINLKSYNWTAGVGVRF